MKLTARSEGRNDRHARIGVFQDGGKAGVLTVEARAEAEVLACINAHADLLEACKVALATLENIAAHEPREDRLGIQGAIRAAIAKVEGKDHPCPSNA